MRLRALMRAGARMIGASAVFAALVTALGVQGGWTGWVFALLFLGGLTDMLIAGMFTFAALMSDPDGGRLAVEFGKDGIRAWWGDGACERQAEYVEARDRGTSRKAPYAQPDSGLRWAYPAGLSYRAPWAPEKRLASAEFQFPHDGCPVCETWRWDTGR